MRVDEDEEKEWNEGNRRRLEEEQMEEDWRRRRMKRNESRGHLSDRSEQRGMPRKAAHATSIGRS